MRTFYVFKIKKEITILLKETPYNLFKLLDEIYLDNNRISVSFNMYNEIVDLYDKDFINERLNNLFVDYKYYSRDGDVHYIYNKYRPENTTLRVYKSYIVLKSDVIKPTLLINYLKSDNLFVCDFKNKDYFWLNDFISIKN